MKRKQPAGRTAHYRIILCVGLCGVLLTGCQEAIDFTRKPIEKSQAGGHPSVKAPIFVVARADTAPLKTEIAARIPERILRIARWVRKAACVEQNGRTRCVSARVRGDVTQSGEMKIVGAPDGFQIQIPMTYTFYVKGSGVARKVEETVNGQFVIAANYRITLDQAWQPVVSYKNNIDAQAADNIKILAAQIDLADAIERKLRRPFRNLASAFEGALDTSAASKIVEKTWRHLHYPVSLMKDPPLWVRAEPEKVAFGGINVLDDSLELRVAIIADIKSYAKARPVPLIARNMPPLDPQPLKEAATHLLMPVDLSYIEIASRIRTALDKNGAIQPREFGKAKSFAIKSVKLFPAGGRLALAVDLEAELESSWQNLKGTAYLLGTPSLENGKSRLGLKLAEFSAPTQSPSFFDAGRFILPEKPFVDAFRAGLSIDLKDRFSSILVQGNQLAQSDFAKGNQMRGRFDDLKVHSIETHDKGLRINLDLVGALSVYPGSGQFASGTGAVEPSSSAQ